MYKFNFYLIKKEEIEKAEKLQLNLLELAKKDKYKSILDKDFIESNHSFFRESLSVLDEEENYSKKLIASYYSELSQAEIFLPKGLSLKEWYEQLNKNKDKYIIIKYLEADKNNLVITESDGQTYSLNDFLTKQLHLDDKNTNIIYSTYDNYFSNSFLETPSYKMNKLRDSISPDFDNNWKTVVISDENIFSTNILEKINNILKEKLQIKKINPYAFEYFCEQILHTYHVPILEFSNRECEIPVFYCELTKRQELFSTKDNKRILDDNGNPIFRWITDDDIHATGLLSILLSNNSGYLPELLVDKKFKPFNKEKFLQEIINSCGEKNLEQGMPILTSIPLNILKDDEDNHGLVDFEGNVTQYIVLQIEGSEKILVKEYNPDLDPLNTDFKIKK